MRPSACINLNRFCPELTANDSNIEKRKNRTANGGTSPNHSLSNISASTHTGTINIYIINHVNRVPLLTKLTAYSFSPAA